MFKDDAWLAGFADGEGSFNIAKNTGNGFVPRFKISLRIDDIEVLERLCAEFGGFVSKVAGTKNMNQAGQWVVSGKRDLPGLVEYFDRFPLRAKKAQDFGFWRIAVQEYCAHGGKAPKLPLLRELLMEGRKWKNFLVS